MKKHFSILRGIVISTFLALIVITCKPQEYPDILGVWEGVLLIDDKEFPIGFHIQEKDEDYYTTLSSPSQGVKDIPTNTTTYDKGVLTIIFKPANIEYVASVKDDKLLGTFYQDESKTSLELTRSE